MNRYERFDRLIKEVNKGTYPSVKQLCELFEIKERTLYADLAYMRDFMQVEITYDDARGGYFNPDPNRKLPEFDLSQGEVLALTIGKDMLTEYSGTVFEPILRTALDKIAERLPEKVRMDLPNLVSVVRFKASGVAAADKATFFELNRACEDRYVTNIHYVSASKGQATFRDIEPLRLVEHRGAWYVIAWCRIRHELRMFALHRILECKVSNVRFEEREDIDIEKYVAEPFLLEHGDPPQTYRVRFDAEAARYVTEREWHSSQKIETHDDGSCTISFVATRMDEVRRWVLGYGAAAEVLEPQKLRKIMLDEFKRASARYEKAPVQLRPKPSKTAARTRANGKRDAALAEDEAKEELKP